MVADAGAVSARTLARLALLLGVAGLSACGAGPYYRWGPYEPLVYEMYTEPGKADPGVQVERLTRDIGEAAAKGERIAPGVYAHLGYMYVLQGNGAAARAALETEKQLFPEGAVFVDRLLGKLEAP